MVISVEFPNDREAEAFAGRFDGKEPPGPTQPGIEVRILLGHRAPVPKPCLVIVPGL